MRLILSGIFLVLCAASWVYSGQSITIVRGQDFPPYHFLDKDRKETGFLIEMILKTAEELELDVEFRQYPWSRCLYLVESGGADAMMNLFKTPERESFMYFPETFLAREQNRFFVLKDSALSFQGELSSLRGVRIGAVRNYSYGKTFDTYRDQLIILELETEKALIMNLIGERCDIILGNDLVIQSLALKIHGGDRIRPSGSDMTNDPLYIGFSKAKGHKKLAEAFSRALADFKAGQAYKKMMEDYGL